METKRTWNLYKSTGVHEIIYGRCLWRKWNCALNLPLHLLVTLMATAGTPFNMPRSNITFGLISLYFSVKKRLCYISRNIIPNPTADVDHFLWASFWAFSCIKTISQTFSKLRYGFFLAPFKSKGLGRIGMAHVVMLFQAVDRRTARCSIMLWWVVAVSSC